MEIYLVRHGQTLFNQQKKVQGWCDSPLTQEGIQQAIAVSKHCSRFLLSVPIVQRVKELWIRCIIFYKIEVCHMPM